MAQNSNIVEQQQITSNKLTNESERSNTIASNIQQYSTFDKSFQNGLTLNSGVAVPILWQEVYPSDIYDIDISALIRLSAQKSTPFMNINFDVSTFFVPYNQIDREFKQLMGENNDYGYSDTNIEFPKIVIDDPEFTYTEDDLASYLGVPLNTKMCSTDKTYQEELNIYPFIAYGKIINEWYRDQNLQGSIDITSVYKDDTRAIKASSYKKSMSHYESIIYGKGLAPTSKLPDYFTTNLPYQQKGKPIELGSYKLEDLYITNNIDPESERKLFSPNWYNSSGAVVGEGNVLGVTKGATYVGKEPGGAKIGDAYMDLTIKAKGNPLPFNIIDFRNSLVLQHLLENFALCGSRYIEQLQSIWGITIDPKEINQSELIGGYNDSLIYNNVTQTSQTTESSQLGNISSNLYNKADCPHVTYSASQHGFIFSILTIRTPINNGGQGLPKFFGYKNFLQMFNPMFNGISEQPTLNKELYYNDVDFTKNNKTFGFNEPFLNTKYNIDKCCGFLSVRSKTSLFTKFMFGEKYTDTPILSDEWMRYNPNIIGNTLYTVSSTTKEFYHQFVALVTFNIKYTTQQPLFNNPKVYGI